MSYYQYVIYDTDQANAYSSDGVVVEISDLYTTIEVCNADAKNRLNELAKEWDNETKFDYAIYDTPIKE